MTSGLLRHLGSWVVPVLLAGCVAVTPPGHIDHPADVVRSPDTAWPVVSG